MKCWQCNEQLIWGGDHTGEDYDNEDYDNEDYDNEDYEIVTNLSCPKCDALVLVYHQKKQFDVE